MDSHTHTFWTGAAVYTSCITYTHGRTYTSAASIHCDLLGELTLLSGVEIHSFSFACLKSREDSGLSDSKISYKYYFVLCTLPIRCHRYYFEKSAGMMVKRWATPSSTWAQHRMLNSAKYTAHAFIVAREIGGQSVNSCFCEKSSSGWMKKKGYGRRWKHS